jgi:hypothetical protein
MLNLVVAPGADLALDLLDDDLTATTPRLQRMLGHHALTLLDHPPDQDLERRASVLFRNADRDRVIRAAAEKALDRALNATPAQAKSASITCRIWRNQDGDLAMASRKLLTRRSTLSTTDARGGARRHGRETIAALVRKEIQDAEMTSEERNAAAQLLSMLRRVRLLPENVELNAASVLASDRIVSRKVKDLCLSCTAIVESIATATIDSSNYTWVGAAELRNMLRAWLQRQPVGEEILAITPFTDIEANQTGSYT